MERQLLFEMVAKATTLVEVTDRVADCRDPKDDKFLELAASGGAAVIVTGDADLLALNPWRDVAVLTPRQFLEST